MPRPRATPASAEYDAAVAHEVESFAKLPEGASLDLRLADAGEFVAGAIEGVCARTFVPAPQGFTYGKDVDIGPDGPPCASARCG
jgi:hypothetical protein